MSAPPAPRAPRWTWSLVAIGALVALASEVYVLFAGTYVPYIDWSNHLGLIAILGHGESMGALDFAERSWLSPRPYLLFYAVAAGLSFVVPVPAAAKLAIAGSAGLGVLSMAGLARQLDRPVIVALLAPLALYGYPRGYGFSSFVFTLAFVWWALARFEVLLRRAATDAPANAPADDRTDDRMAGAAAWFSVALLTVYLGHALWALPVGLAVGVRLVVFSIRRRRRAVLRAAVATGLAGLPAVACAAYAWSDFGPSRAGITLHREGAQIFVWGASLAQRWSGLGGHMLERGSPAHWTTMYGVAALWITLAAIAVAMGFRRSRDGGSGITEGDRGAAVYAAVFGLLYAVGPESIGWPMGVWMVYPRYATAGALALFLIPRVGLGRWASGLLAAVALALVAHNAVVNHRHVAGFSRWAERYDPVRSAVPSQATVMALTGYDPGDWISAHPALGSLYFYHLCDGAAYTAFLFDNPMHPVRVKPDGPEAPPWNDTGRYSPAVHGRAFDYLVLRGRRFVTPTRTAGFHEVVLEHEGWVVFKTKDPPPRGPRSKD